MNRHFTRLLFLLLLSFGAALPAFAQSGSISGKVTDAHAAVISGAQVQVINQATSAVVATTKTDDEGNYVVRLPAGRYQVTIQAQDFSPSRSAVTLTDGQTLANDVRLGIAGLQASVTVTGQADSIPNANPVVKAGPFTGTDIQDLPYSYTVVPSTLIDNIQAFEPENLVKVIPQISATNSQQNISGNPFFYVRGFAVTGFTNSAGVTYDGLVVPAGGEFNNVLEDKERVEFLSGTDGFLYGMGSVGGNFNYVLKRPTETRFFSVIAGDNAGENGYVHLDMGGPIGKRFGYRINAVDQDGPTSIKYQSIKRDLVSAAFDIHVRPNVLVQLNYTHADYITNGLTPGFSLVSTLTAYPTPPDPGSIFTAPWVQFRTRVDTGGMKVTWKISKVFTFRTFYDYTYEARPQQSSESILVNDSAGDYTSSFAYNHQPQWYRTHAIYGFLDSDFKTFGIHHTLTLGFNGAYSYNQVVGLDTEYVANTFSGNIYNEVLAPRPTGLTTTNTLNTSSSGILNENLLIGDDINLGKGFHVLAGINEVIYKRHTFRAPAYLIVGTSSYDTSKITPSVALTYQPIKQVTTYFSYQQSLSPGLLVQNSGSTVFTNNGAILPPYSSDQYEIGAKANLSPGILLTAALFQINRALQYSVDNGNGTFTEVQSGREIHKGLELTASGKARRDLTLIGGITWLDPKVANNANTPFQNGKRPSNVSDISAKIYTEYDVPRLRGLTAIGGIQYAGQYYAVLPTNSTMPVRSLPGYAIENLGLRYTAHLVDRPLTFRFNVDNLINKAYWEVAARVGMPRTFSATAQYQF